MKLNCKLQLYNIYKILLNKFGNQNWWPTISNDKKRKRLEICIGAILTQNTNWKNVEKSILNLYKANILDENRLRDISIKKLALLIRPSGYYNIKAKRIKAFLSFLKTYTLEKIEKTETNKARELLLSVYGIGKETADSILLYAFDKPIFVIDAYTKRIFTHVLKLKFDSYEEWQRFFMNNLPHIPKLFNEYHALLVKLGKEYCRTKPLCKNCPLYTMPCRLTS